MGDILMSYDLMIYNAGIAKSAIQDILNTYNELLNSIELSSMPEISIRRGPDNKELRDESIFGFGFLEAFCVCVEGQVHSFDISYIGEEGDEVSDIFLASSLIGRNTNIIKLVHLLFNLSVAETLGLVLEEDCEVWIKSSYRIEYKKLIKLFKGIIIKNNIHNSFQFADLVVKNRPFRFDLDFDWNK